MTANTDKFQLPGQTERDALRGDMIRPKALQRADSCKVNPTLKRKCFRDACDKLPKLIKVDSEGSFTNSQPAEPDSQTSNYSDCSDILSNKHRNNFDRLMSCLKEIEQSKSLELLQPLDLTVKNRTLTNYAVIVGNIWKLVLETVTLKTDSESIGAANDFLKTVVESFEIKQDGNVQQISLALNVLRSIKEYYNLAASGSSRESTATRKQILLAVTGRPVREAKQLNILADEIEARHATVVSEAKKRAELDEQQKLIPYLDVLGRKSPEGARIVTDEEKMKVIDFYESEIVSDVLKGHNNVMKEVFEGPAGGKCVLNRQKRVIKVHLIDLLPSAQKEISFKYSLRTLLKLRPKWVLLSKEAHILNCLCDRCANIKEILRCLSNFTRKVKLHGSCPDKAALASFQISTSISELISRVLHPKCEGQKWHRPECYNQTCTSSKEFPCGTEKMMRQF